METAQPAPVPAAAPIATEPAPAVLSEDAIPPLQPPPIVPQQPVVPVVPVEQPLAAPTPPIQPVPPTPPVQPTPTAPPAAVPTAAPTPPPAQVQTAAPTPAPPKPNKKVKVSQSELIIMEPHGRTHLKLLEKIKLLQYWIKMVRIRPCSSLSLAFAGLLLSCVFMIHCLLYDMHNDDSVCMFYCGIAIASFPLFRFCVHSAFLYIVMGVAIRAHRRCRY